MIPPEANDPILISLSRRHQALLTASAAGKIPEADVRQFMDDLVAAGAHFPGGSGRDALRNMLYFWSSEAMAREGRTSPESLPRLADYQESRSAESPPAAAQQQRDDAVTERSRRILQTAALARRWKATPEAEAQGYLLSGKALVAAREIANEDPDIAALVKASEASEKWRKRLQTGAIFVLVSLALSTLTWLYLNERAQEQALRVSQTAAVNDRARMYTDIAGIVDALSQDNLDPLKDFLRIYGKADPALTKRLTLKPATAASLGAASTIPLVKPFDVAVAQDFSAGADQCTGYLWLGSDRDDRLANGRKPSMLAAGATVTLDADSSVKLRSDFPEEATYALKPQIGVVPGGATVTLVGAPKSFLRSTNDGGTINQYWVQVSVPSIFCTTVYVQYFGDAGKINPILGAIAATGAQAPPAEQISSAEGLSEVRYFYPQDRKVAALIAQRLGPPLQPRQISLRDLTAFKNRPRQGILELWIDLGGS